MLITTRWCGHCKKLAPVWDGLQEFLIAEGVTNIKVGKVDCTEQKTVCSRFGVNGYPHLKYFAGGKMSQFSGPRTNEGFKAYVTQGHANPEAVPGIGVVTPPPTRDRPGAEMPKQYVRIFDDKNFDHFLSQNKVREHSE
jgi:protein disulfide-isomerase A6